MQPPDNCQLSHHTQNLHIVSTFSKLWDCVCVCVYKRALIVSLKHNYSVTWNNRWNILVLITFETTKYLFRFVFISCFIIVTTIYITCPGILLCLIWMLPKFQLSLDTHTLNNIVKQLIFLSAAKQIPSISPLMKYFPQFLNFFFTTVMIGRQSTWLFQVT